MINLLPNNIREEHSFGRKNKKLVALIFLVAGTAVAVAGIMLFNLKYIDDEATSVRSAIEKNEETIKKLETETNDLGAVSSRLNSTFALYEQSIRFSEIIPEIGSVLPAGSIIDGLSLTGGSTDPLQLNVSLTSADLAAVLQKNLVESELFEAADIISITPGGSEGSRYQYTSSVAVSFTGSAEAKRKEAAAAAAAAEAKKQQAEEDSE